MKHWFIDWLEEKAEIRSVRAKEYRDALESDVPEAKSLLEAFEDRSKVIERAQKHEADVVRLKEWASLAADMISCGLEKEALAYYDARQAIETWLLPPRRKFELTHAITGLFEYLEQRIKESQDTESIKSLEVALATVVELFAVGMDEEAIAYYLRKMRKNPELNLAEPEIYSG